MAVKYAEEEYLKMKKKQKAKKYDVENYQFVLERYKKEAVTYLIFFWLILGFNERENRRIESDLQILWLDNEEIRDFSRNRRERIIRHPAAIATFKKHSDETSHKQWLKNLEPLIAVLINRESYPWKRCLKEKIT